ncbi:MAG: UDP-N-acetylmuramoyl-L-alanine--D-glutamate ligase [Actinomycetota bacterium]|nr:UDP-N-acetylmuramoyl-L-alanine--D-glutamate ligase [Actinomycetota bacterium]
MNFLGKHVLVLGLGLSGKAASLKLKSLGAEVIASDTSKSNEMLDVAQGLKASGVDVRLGSQGKELLDGVDLVVVSPGVPSRSLIINEARSLEIPVWSEIELAYQLTGKQIIAITGTNGKTTTTTLIGKIFEAAGKKAAAVGNIGTPLVSSIDRENIDTLIAEVSSFQLDTIVDFKPAVSVLLNITEDHLDWHPDFSDYVRAKSRLFMNQTEDDFAILNLDDKVVRSLVSGIRAKVIGTSKGELEEGIFIKEGQVVARLEAKLGQQEIEIFNINEMKLRGSHNLDNVMAAVAVSLVSGIDAEVIRKVVTRFPGLSHRIEFVASIDGVMYYDDSKATNVDATVKALTAFTEPVILLVGGRNKGNSFKPLAEAIDKEDKKVKAVVGFGEAGRDILGALPQDVYKEYTERVDDAVLAASRLAEAGQVVLFSPACASFDAFKSYAHRGEIFKKAVLAIGERNGKGWTDR